MAQVVEIPALSTEFVRVQVRAEASGDPYDPTGATVEMAFKPGTTPPETGDWETAAWETDDDTGPPTYRALCLVGPDGGLELAPDTWRVWVRVDTGTERPVRPAGFIKIV